MKPDAKKPEDYGAIYTLKEPIPCDCTSIYNRIYMKDSTKNNVQLGFYVSLPQRKCINKPMILQYGKYHVAFKLETINTLNIKTVADYNFHVRTDKTYGEFNLQEEKSDMRIIDVSIIENKEAIPND